MSLKDQLLKTGLANAKKARKAEHEKRQDAKNPDADTARKFAQQALTEKTERDRELNRVQQQEKAQKERVAQVRQMIETQRITRKGGEIAYQFTDAKKIKKLYVNAEQQGQLTRGQIAIVRLGESYELVPTIVAEKIRTRDDRAIVLLNVRASTEAADADDPYADYKIPDDLMW